MDPLSVRVDEKCENRSQTKEQIHEHEHNETNVTGENNTAAAVRA